MFSTKRTFYVFFILLFAMGVHTPGRSSVQSEVNLPASPIFQPRVVILNYGKKLICDYVWREGETIFLVVHGKKFAVGYRPGQIDMEKSFGLVQVSPGANAPHQGDKESIILELLEKSGMAALVDQVPGFYQSGLAQNQGKLPPNVYKAMMEAARKAYDPVKMRKRTIEGLDQRLDVALMQEVLGWLRSPLGQKITALETAAATPEGVREVKAFGARVQGNPPPQRRLNLIQRLDASTGASKKQVDVTLFLLLQTFTAMDQVLPKEKRIGAAMISKQMESSRSEMIRSAKQEILVGYLYTYQSLSDEELERYVAFAESDSGKVYHERTFEAMKAALSEAAKENGRALAGIQGLVGS